MECVNYAAAATTVNDRITYATLSTTTAASYVSSSWSYSVVPLSATYTHGGVIKTISGDMNLVTFKKNTYTRNYASGGNGIVDILGMPRVTFDSETFVSNGDSIKEVVDLYGGSGNLNNLGTSALDMTLNQAYTTSISTVNFC
jgi:hypothetical protein